MPIKSKNQSGAPVTTSGSRRGNAKEVGNARSPVASVTTSVAICGSGWSLQDLPIEGWDILRTVALEHYVWEKHALQKLKENAKKFEDPLTPDKENLLLDTLITIALDILEDGKPRRSLEAIKYIVDEESWMNLKATLAKILGLLEETSQSGLVVSVERISPIREHITLFAGLLEALFGLPGVSKPSAAADIMSIASRFQCWVNFVTFFDGHGLFDSAVQGGLGLSTIRFAPANDEDAVRYPLDAIGDVMMDFEKMASPAAKPFPRKISAGLPSEVIKKTPKQTAQTSAPIKTISATIATKPMSRVQAVHHPLLNCMLEAPPRIHPFICKYVFQLFQTSDGSKGIAPGWFTSFVRKEGGNTMVMMEELLLSIVLTGEMISRHIKKIDKGQDLTQELRDAKTIGLKDALDRSSTIVLTKFCEVVIALLAGKELKMSKELCGDMDREQKEGLFQTTDTKAIFPSYASHKTGIRFLTTKEEGSNECPDCLEWGFRHRVTNNDLSTWFDRNPRYKIFHNDNIQMSDFAELEFIQTEADFSLFMISFYALQYSVKSMSDEYHPEMIDKGFLTEMDFLPSTEITIRGESKMKFLFDSSWYQHIGIRLKDCLAATNVRRRRAREALVDIRKYGEFMEQAPILTPISPFPRNIGLKGSLDQEGLVRHRKFYQSPLLREEDPPNLVKWFTSNPPGVYIDRLDLGLQAAFLTISSFSLMALQMDNELSKKSTGEHAEWLLKFLETDQFDSLLQPTELHRLLMYAAKSLRSLKAIKTTANVKPTWLNLQLEQMDKLIVWWEGDRTWMIQLMRGAANAEFILKAEEIRQSLADSNDFHEVDEMSNTKEIALAAKVSEKYLTWREKIQKGIGPAYLTNNNLIDYCTALADGCYEAVKPMHLWYEAIGNRIVLIKETRLTTYKNFYIPEVDTLEETIEFGSVYPDAEDPEDELPSEGEDDKFGKLSEDGRNRFGQIMPTGTRPTPKFDVTFNRPQETTTMLPRPPRFLYKSYPSEQERLKKERQKKLDDEGEKLLKDIFGDSEMEELQNKMMQSTKRQEIQTQQISRLEEMVEKVDDAVRKMENSVSTRLDKELTKISTQLEMQSREVSSQIGQLTDIVRLLSDRRSPESAVPLKRARLQQAVKATESVQMFMQAVRVQLLNNMTPMPLEDIGLWEFLIEGNEMMEAMTDLEIRVTHHEGDQTTLSGLVTWTNRPEGMINLEDLLGTWVAVRRPVDQDSSPEQMVISEARDQSGKSTKGKSSDSRLAAGGLNRSLSKSTGSGSGSNRMRDSAGDTSDGDDSDHSSRNDRSQSPLPRRKAQVKPTRWEQDQIYMTKADRSSVEDRWTGIKEMSANDEVKMRRNLLKDVDELKRNKTLQAYTGKDTKESSFAHYLLTFADQLKTYLNFNGHTDIDGETIKASLLKFLDSNLIETFGKDFRQKFLARTWDDKASKPVNSDFFDSEGKWAFVHEATTMNHLDPSCAQRYIHDCYVNVYKGASSLDDMKKALYLSPIKTRIEYIDQSSSWLRFLSHVHNNVQLEFLLLLRKVLHPTLWKSILKKWKAGEFPPELTNSLLRQKGEWIKFPFGRDGQLSLDLSSSSLSCVSHAIMHMMLQVFEEDDTLIGISGLDRKLSTERTVGEGTKTQPIVVASVQDEKSTLSDKEVEHLKSLASMMENKEFLQLLRAPKLPGEEDKHIPIKPFDADRNDVNVQPLTSLFPPRSPMRPVTWGAARNTYSTPDRPPYQNRQRSPNQTYIPMVNPGDSNGRTPSFQPRSQVCRFASAKCPFLQKGSCRYSHTDLMTKAELGQAQEVVPVRLLLDEITAEVDFEQLDQMAHAYQLDPEDGESVGITVNRIFKVLIDDKHVETEEEAVRILISKVSRCNLSEEGMAPHGHSLVN